ncbi:MAG: HAMP domain-containing protein [Anaerolineae bacterium]|nr:HAMP domain-containing protein [Anaerolineae bacterium]
MSAQMPVPGLSLRWRVQLPILVCAALVLLLGAWVLSASSDTELRGRLPAFVGVAALLPVLASLFAGMRIASRARQAAVAVEQLAAGHRTARADVGPQDELGRIGSALNAYANYVQEKADELRGQLRQARQDGLRLEAAIANMPDGVVVLDLSGSVILMNAPARTVLGASQHTEDSVRLTAAVTDKLGEALAPGVYALGDPLRISVENRIIQAQVAAVMSTENARLGTVIVLREVASEDDALMVTHEESVIPLETLVWKVTNEWRQIAETNNVDLQVDIKARGLKVRGDIQRLSWALGGVMDNALKYTPTGGTIVIQAREPENGAITIRLRDSGVGIKREELPHVFTRFYRGTPVTEDGRPIKVPGMGQGLALTKEIIEAHGGAVSVKSKPGSGTAVYVTLPLAEAE